MAAAAAPGRGPTEQTLKLCHPSGDKSNHFMPWEVLMLVASGPGRGSPQPDRLPIVPTLFSSGVWVKFFFSPQGSPTWQPILGCFLEPPCFSAPDTRLSSVFFPPVEPSTTVQQPWS